MSQLSAHSKPPVTHPLIAPITGWVIDGQRTVEQVLAGAALPPMRPALISFRSTPALESGICAVKDHHVDVVVGLRPAHRTACLATSSSMVRVGGAERESPDPVGGFDQQHIIISHGVSLSSGVCAETSPSFRGLQPAATNKRRSRPSRSVRAQGQRDHGSISGRRGRSRRPSPRSLPPRHACCRIRRTCAAARSSFAAAPTGSTRARLTATCEQACAQGMERGGARALRRAADRAAAQGPHARDTFEVAAQRFLLFPTVAHSHRTRAEDTTAILSAPARRQRRRSHHVACWEPVAAVSVSNPDGLTDIEPLHIWTQESVRVYAWISVRSTG